MNQEVPSPLNVAHFRAPLWQRAVVAALLGWAMLVAGLVLFAGWQNPVHRAVLGMVWGLILVWILGGGWVMWYWREPLTRWASRLPLPWMLKFVLGCVLLAMTEEAITTALTHGAPLFGVRVGEAYITASANYLDVILYHSVVVFVPLFVAWAVMLRRWAFSPFAVFLLFGITGTLCESLSFGWQNLLNLGMWTLVYGLMVWLPACGVPPRPTARPPRWWNYPLAVILPFLFLPTLLLFAPWLWLTPKHPSIHFPPLGGGM